MNSTSVTDPPGVTTRSMAAKRKAEEAETDASKKARLSDQPSPHGVITRSVTAKLKVESPKEKKNVVIAKRGTLIHQRLLLSESNNISLKKLRFSGQYRRQHWSLRESIMYYIINNPTAKSHQKLIQCCKYFFAKNPVFVILDLNHYDGKWKISPCSLPLDIAKIDASKLWISGCISVQPATSQNILSSLIPKINRCEIKRLYLAYQTLSYGDFMFIAASVETFAGYSVTVIDYDGSVVPLEKIVEALPKVKSIDYHRVPAIFTSSTLKDLVKMAHFSQLHVFYLHDIPETFDLDSFSAYMKQNKTTYISLDFDRSISEAYKNHLESIIDEIINARTYDFKIPLIAFSGLDSTKKEKLFSCYISH